MSPQTFSSDITYSNSIDYICDSSGSLLLIKIVSSMGQSGSLDDLSKIFKDYGLHHCNGGWIFRDWVPNAKYVSLVGDFNGWKETATPLKKDDNAGSDIWFCFIGPPLNAAMTKGSQYRLHVVPVEGESREMMPLWAIRYAVNSKTQAVNAVVWPTSISRGPSRKDLHEEPLPLAGKKLHLLEFDITLVSQKDEKSSLKFARTILARAAHSGYHGVVIVGLFHAGVRATSSLLAATPALKDASEFPAFLQYAHDRKLAVFLEVPSRAIAGKSYLPSYFFTDQKDVMQKLDFGRKEVAQYLLYCLQYLACKLCESRIVPLGAGVESCVKGTMEYAEYCGIACVSDF